MIINFSGCDGVGKSSISKEVCDILNGKYIHFSAPKNKEAAKQEYLNFISKAINPEKVHVLDRFYEGEWTYAPIYRNYIGDYAREMEDAIIGQQDYLYVYVKAELETIIKRTRARGEDFAREEDFQTILDNYQNFLMDQRLPFTIIDNGEGKNIKDCILSAHNDIIMSKLIWSAHRKTGVLPRGNIRPKYFVVGPNPDTNVNPGKPVLAMSRGEVSELTIKKLKAKGIYLDCWFTTPDFVDFERILLEPQEILYMEDIINDKA